MQGVPASSSAHIEGRKACVRLLTSITECSGVKPSSLQAFGSAPASIRRAMTRFAVHVVQFTEACSAVFLDLPCQLTRAPWSRSRLMMSSRLSPYAECTIRGVSRYLSQTLGSAPAARRCCASLTSVTMARGDMPCELQRLGSAPASRRATSTSNEPVYAALMSGVRPWPTGVPSGLTPSASSLFTVGKSPVLAATASCSAPKRGLRPPAVGMPRGFDMTHSMQIVGCYDRKCGEIDQGSSRVPSSVAMQ